MKLFGFAPTRTIRALWMLREGQSSAPRARSNVSRTVIACLALDVGCGGGTGLQVDGAAAGRGSSTGAAAGRCGSPASDAAESSVGAVSNDPRCPTAWSDVSPSALCAVNGLICTYPDGQAECAPDGAPLKWWTDGPTAGCSETAPKVGTACPVPGLSCEYITGPPSLESTFTTRYCCDGARCVWERQGSEGCPNGNTCGTIKASRRRSCPS